MFSKWFERSDDKFLSQAKHPVQRDGFLEQLTRARPGFVIAIAIFVLLAIAEWLLDKSTVALSFLTLLIASSYIVDLRIKMLKLISAIQQESSDTKTPEKDQTS